MPISRNDAQQELFTNNYRVWEKASPPRDMSNGPKGCSQIAHDTANALRNMWHPGSSPNTWKQSNVKAYVTNDGIRRWVTRSVSGGNMVVDFHARWKTYRFLWHFKIV